MTLAERPRALMIAMSAVALDARIQREVHALDEAGVDVTLIGLDGPSWGQAPARFAAVTVPRHTRPGVVARTPAGVRRRAVRAARWLLLPRHRARAEARFRQDVRERARNVRYDLVHAHDLPALSVGAEVAAAASVPLLYDAHECWTGRARFGRPTPVRNRRDRRREATLGHSAAVVLTVSDGLRRWFEDTYGWTHVRVVRNSFPAVAPRACDSPEAIVYAGRIAGGRDLETIVAAADALDGLGTILVGPRDPSFALPAHPHVQIEEPVSVADVTGRLQQGGLAVVPLTDSCLNHRLALPNKLFQAAQAGVPVVAADLPELRRHVERFGLGTLYRPGSVSSYAAAVEQARDQYLGLRETVREAAPELSWPVDAARLVEAYRELGMVAG